MSNMEPNRLAYFSILIMFRSLSSVIFFSFDFIWQYMFLFIYFLYVKIKFTGFTCSITYSMLSLWLSTKFSAVVFLLPDEGYYFPQCSCAPWWEQFLMGYAWDNCKTAGQLPICCYCTQYVCVQDSSNAECGGSHKWMVSTVHRLKQGLYMEATY